MARYRIYLLDGADRVDAIFHRDFASDDDAQSFAEGLRAGHAAAEVWLGGELIARTGVSFTPFASKEALRPNALSRADRATL